MVVLEDGWWPDLSPSDYSWTGTSCLNGQEIGLNIENFDFPKRRETSKPFSISDNYILPRKELELDSFF